MSERLTECKGCGKSISIEAKYCPQCGMVDPTEKVVSERLTKCKDCGKTVSLKALSCPHCGSPNPAKRDCRGCGKEVSLEEKSCPHCHALDPVAPTPTPTPPIYLDPVAPTPTPSVKPTEKPRITANYRQQTETPPPSEEWEEKIRWEEPPLEKWAEIRWEEILYIANITFGSISLVIFGLIFLKISFLKSIFYFFMEALGIAVSSVLFFEKSRKFIKDKWNIDFSETVRTFLQIALFFIMLGSLIFGGINLNKERQKRNKEIYKERQKRNKEIWLKKNIELAKRNEEIWKKNEERQKAANETLRKALKKGETLETLSKKRLLELLKDIDGVTSEDKIKERAKNNIRERIDEIEWQKKREKERKERERKEKKERKERELVEGGKKRVEKRMGKKLEALSYKELGDLCEKLGEDQYKILAKWDSINKKLESKKIQLTATQKQALKKKLDRLERKEKINGSEYTPVCDLFLEKRKNKYQREKEKKKEIRSKMPKCFSSYDGSHRNFVRVLKDNYLKDPDSFEHIKTTVRKINFDENSNPDGTITVFMKYRARNAFGGYVIEYIVADFDADCNFVRFVEHTSLH